MNSLEQRRALAPMADLITSRLQGESDALRFLALLQINCADGDEMLREIQRIGEADDVNLLAGFARTVQKKLMA